MTRKGLILEGGAMRGLFSAGVMDVMMQNGIVFDGAVGVSAGAAFGCNYKSKQIGRAIRYNTQNSRNPRYSSLRSLLTSGDLFNAEFCYHTLPRTLDRFDVEAFRANPMEFYVVCTDVHTGEPVYHRLETADDTDMEWIRASASMPVVSKVVEVDGYSLLDGGIADSIPVRWFESIGYDHNVAVLTRPLEYRKEPASPVLLSMMKKYPKMQEAMKHRHEVYNETLEYITEKEKNGDLFVIRPSAPLPIGRIEHSVAKLQETYSLGREAMETQLEDLKAYLAR